MPVTEDSGLVKQAKDEEKKTYMLASIDLVGREVSTVFEAVTSQGL